MSEVWLIKVVLVTIFFISFVSQVSRRGRASALEWFTPSVWRQSTRPAPPLASLNSEQTPHRPLETLTWVILNEWSTITFREFIENHVVCEYFIDIIFSRSHHHRTSSQSPHKFDSPLATDGTIRMNHCSTSLDWRRLSEYRPKDYFFCKLWVRESNVLTVPFSDPTTLLLWPGSRSRWQESIWHICRQASVGTIGL